MAIWTQKTKKGRVVYDRPKHRFTFCDVRRIVRTVLDDPGRPGSAKNRRCGLDSASFLLSWVSQEDPESGEFYGETLGRINELKALPENNPFAGSGSGEFSGGGASRPFPRERLEPPDPDPDGGGKEDS